MGAWRLYAPGLGEKLVPGVADSLEHGVVIVEQPVREEA